MLSADDPLPHRPERVLVAGVTGSGKTTLARRLGELWGLRHVEIDALFHQPGWRERPHEEMIRILGEIAARDAPLRRFAPVRAAHRHPPQPPSR